MNMFNFLKKLFGPSIDFKALADAGAVIIDVRSPQAFDLGHIKGSRNIPVNIIEREVNMLKKLNKPVITVCQSGARSGMAKSVLKAAGIEVYNGGSWNGLNLKIK
jgi:rhodanese-related sulfurtransferase